MPGVVDEQTVLVRQAPLERGERPNDPFARGLLVIQLDHALLGEPVALDQELGDRLGVLPCRLELLVLVHAGVFVDTDDQGPVVALDKIIGISPCGGFGRLRLDLDAGFDGIGGDKKRQADDTDEEEPKRETTSECNVGALLAAPSFCQVKRAAIWMTPGFHGTIHFPTFSVSYISPHERPTLSCGFLNVMKRVTTIKNEPSPLVKAKEQQRGRAPSLCHCEPKLRAEGAAGSEAISAPSLPGDCFVAKLLAMTE